MTDSPTLLDRTTLVAWLARDVERAHVEKLLGVALPALGWDDKETFSEQECLQVGLAIAELTRLDLAANPDPRARQLAAGIEQMLAPYKARANTR